MAEISIKEHPSTIAQRKQFEASDPPITDRKLVAEDQMAIYFDEDLIGFASKAEGGCINLIVNFAEADAETIRTEVSGLMGVTHEKLSMIPEVTDEVDDLEGEAHDEDSE
jgi:hypothetical protein